MVYSSSKEARLLFTLAITASSSSVALFRTLSLTVTRSWADRGSALRIDSTAELLDDLFGDSPFTQGFVADSRNDSVHNSNDVRGAVGFIAGCVAGSNVGDGLGAG